MPSLRIASCTTEGRRAENEDTVLARRLGGSAAVLAVADGMGGHRGGGEASRVAIEALERELCANSSVELAPRERLVDAFAVAAAEVAEAARAPDREGMGTTLVAALVEGSSAWIAYAGDSEAWLVRSDGVTRLTRPHTVAEEELAAGRITESEALAHPFRHAVSRALGEGEVEPDIVEIERLPRDAVLLLGSDGLLGPLAEHDVLAEFSAAPGLDAGVRSLVLRSIQHGSQDNVSAVAAEHGRFRWRKRRRLSAAAAIATLGAVVALALAAAVGRFDKRAESASTLSSMETVSPAGRGRSTSLERKDANWGSGLGVTSGNEVASPKVGAKPPVKQPAQESPTHRVAVDVSQPKGRPERLEQPTLPKPTPSERVVSPSAEDLGEQRVAALERADSQEAIGIPGSVPDPPVSGEIPVHASPVFAPREESRTEETSSSDAARLQCPPIVLDSSYRRFLPEQIVVTVQLRFDARGSVRHARVLSEDLHKKVRRAVEFGAEKWSLLEGRGRIGATICQVVVETGAVRREENRE